MTKGLLARKLEWRRDVRTIIFVSAGAINQERQSSAESNTESRKQLSYYTIKEIKPIVAGAATGDAWLASL
jgi:hypothetical protein